jgi:hypothetical protein
VIAEISSETRIALSGVDRVCGERLVRTLREANRSLNLLIDMENEGRSIFLFHLATLHLLEEAQSHFHSLNLPENALLMRRLDKYISKAINRMSQNKLSRSKHYTSLALQLAFRLVE